jgi:hypothetical protein
MLLEKLMTPNGRIRSADHAVLCIRCADEGDVRGVGDRRGMPAGAALASRFVCRASFSIRKSPRISTRLGLGPAGGPELRLRNAAPHTRIVFGADIRLDSRKCTRSFKGIVCGDISEFESHMASHAVGPLGIAVSLTPFNCVIEPIGGFTRLRVRGVPPARFYRYRHAARSSSRRRDVAL